MITGRLRIPFWTRRLLVRALRHPTARRRRLAVLLIGLALIAAWQREFFEHASRLDNRYAMAEAMGMNDEWRFVYFMYYLGLYPVVSAEGHLAMLGEPGYRRFRRESAVRVVAERGNTLAMEWGGTIRAGDMGRALLYLPYAVWTHSAREPRLAPTHGVAFAVALGALYAAFWWISHPALGAITVGLLGSNPFQLYEVYAHENVFGWPITAGILSLALSLPLLSSRPPRRLAWLLVPSIGVLLASVRQIRPEPVTILASAVGACLLLARASWRRRAALSALVVVTFAAFSWLWQVYFDYKFEEARRVVASAGGTVFRGPRDRYHMLWHPLWCGLGDFDTKHGYAWSDAAAKRYVLPRLEGRYPEHGALFWDPVYNRLLAEKILTDITRDPLWYFGILARRVARVLTWTTPVRLAVGSWWVDVPWSGLATVPLLAALACTRSWSLLKLALFPLGTSLPGVLVFSGTVPGQTYVGWYHVIGAAILLTALVEAAWHLGRRRWRAGVRRRPTHDRGREHGELEADAVLERTRDR